MAATRGRVITFYSYKGGTGRSMAVANTACILSRQADVKKGVLVIDWDLDAPGLHWFFSSNPPGIAAERFYMRHKGVVELFRQIRHGIRSSPEESVNEEVTERVIREIDIGSFVVETGVPKIKLMPACRVSSAYGDEVSLFDWRELFSVAPTAIRAFAEIVAEQYEYVLIDSRTGLNDISGICTALLPDQLVVVFTPNYQSLIGGIETVKRAVNYRRQSEDIRPLTVYPLPSRVEMSEPEMLETWRFGGSLTHGDPQGYQERFERFAMEVYSLGDCDLKNYFDEVQIQHVPRYSYGEQIAVQQERGTRLSLSRSYAAFANILIKGDSPWEVLPSAQGGAELVSDGSPSHAKVQAAKEYLAEDRFKLKLHDLVATEVKGIVAATSRIPVQGAPDIKGFADRLRTYEGITNDLILLEALLAYWGNSDHRKMIIQGPKQVFDTVRPASGLTLYLNLRAYPALLLLYSGGIAATAGGRYGNLRDLMLFPVSDYNKDPNVRVSFIVPLTEMIFNLESVFKQLPGFERHHTATSDYLYSFLQSSLDDLLLLGSEYERAFDRFELLYSLEYCNQTARGQSSNFWGPIGRFGWKRAALYDLINEAETEKQKWGPIEAGLFDSSIERFKAILDGFTNNLGQLPWR